jgi:type IV secretion system protein TrbF
MTLFSRKKEKEKQQGDSERPSGANQNPHLDRTQGRRIWNDRYLNLAKARRQWQWAFAGVLFIACALLILVFKLSLQSKLIPFVVELNKGMPMGVVSVTSNLPQLDKLTQFSLTQFITNSRTILSDSEAEKMLLDKTYAFSAEDTLGFLRTYYTEHNPFERGAHTTVQIVVLNCLKMSQSTWQITWDEIEKSKNGDAVIDQSRWIATLIVQKSEPNPKFLNDNPFGIYVTQVSWAKIN